MSRASDAANAVVWTVEKTLDLYGVRHTREQSRVVMIEGSAGRFRPMYFGKWIDDDGNIHAKGRADLLARPRIETKTLMAGKMVNCTDPQEASNIIAQVSCLVTVPLWIECKSGKGGLSHDQRAFRHWVTLNGDHYLLIHDDVTPLLDWLTAHNVQKEPRQVIHEKPMGSAEVDALPCRHCGGLKFTDHMGTIFACKAKKAMGKVWSPRLSKSQ